MSKPLRRLEKELDRILVAAFDAKVPSTLCHYTGWDGLAGIIKSRNLWLTDFRTQRTDELEFRHADETILAVASRMALDPHLDQPSRFWLTRLVENWPTNAIAYVGRDGLFLACFCADSRNPKLWDCFANAATGFALEFALMNDERLSGGFGFTMLPVEYDMNDVAAKVEQAFYDTLRAGEHFRKKYPSIDLRASATITMRALLAIAARTSTQAKGAVHRDDREWRLLAIQDPRSTVDIIRCPPRHISVQLRKKHARPAIRTIHIGAAAPPECESRIDDLLDICEYFAGERPALVRANVGG